MSGMSEATGSGVRRAQGGEQTNISVLLSLPHLRFVTNNHAESFWIKLKFENKEKMKENQTYYFNKRKISQPIETYNCGSVFKAVNGVSAGKIIDNLGLKGVKLNGAQISKLHANFIVNLGNATSEDIKELINLIKHKVKEQTGIDLEEEIIFVGD